MRYHNITKDDMLNGDGLRVVLWVAGCDHCCRGCHNPMTWDANGGIVFDGAAKQELFDQLCQPYIEGITFSGGDPLHPANKADIRELIREVKERYPQKTVWLYTGDIWENLYRDPVVAQIDVLVDGEFEEDKKDQKLLWKGSGNQRVIDAQATLHSDDPSCPVLYCGDYR